MFVHTRRLARMAVAGTMLFSAHAVEAQVRTFQACSQGSLKNCAGIRLTSQLGVGPSNANRFDIGIQNLGSQLFPALATSVYFGSFLTGLTAGMPVVDVLSTPTASGGATVSDATPWSLFESGDAIFLSPQGNNGIGNCTFAGPVNGFGLIGQTCGAGQFITFSFFTSRVINVNSVTIGDLEFVAISGGNTADSCNDNTPCTITNATVTPEPSSIALVTVGMFAVLALSIRKRKLRDIRQSLTAEL